MSSTFRPAYAPEQIDFHLRTIDAPRYKLLRVPMNNFPSASTPIGETTTVTLEWKLPVRVYNMYKSFIAYNMNAPLIVGSHTITFEDIFDLGNQVYFGGAAGTALVELNNAQNYTKVARKIDTPLQDFMNNDNMNGLYRCNAPNTSNRVPGGANGANIGSDGYLEAAYSADAGLGVAPAPGPPIVPAAGILNTWRQYPLSAFTNTLLGVDRDFYSPVEQYFRVVAGFGNKMAFSVLDANTSTFINSVPVPGLSINQCYLYLACEQNIKIIEQIVGAANAGSLKYRIPFTTSFRNLGGAAGAQTDIQIQLSQQYGKKLKRILHTTFNGTEQLATAYDHNNYNGLKVLRYQTFIDSLPVQDRLLECSRPSGMVIGMDDWLENRKYLDKTSCIASKEMYQTNWFHIDSWHEPIENDLPEVNKDEGLPMDVSRQWQFSCTNGSQAGCIHYTWATFSRDVLITPAGPVFV